MSPPRSADREPGEVFNQPPPLEDYNLFAADVPLQEALRREGAAWAESTVSEFGALMGSAETLRLGEQANRHPPTLRTHDRFGHRVDEVDFHPAWHELLQIGVAHQHHSLPWTNPRAGAHVARAVLNMLRHQVEEGASCPLTMTFAVVPSLRLQPEMAAEWLPRILSHQYDSRFIPPAQKRGVLFGMAPRNGRRFDVQSNTTRRALGRSRAQHTNKGPSGYSLDVRRVLDPRPSRKRFVLFPAAAPAAGWHTQRFFPATSERQTGQPFECLQRS